MSWAVRLELIRFIFKIYQLLPQLPVVSPPVVSFPPVFEPSKVKQLEEDGYFSIFRVKNKLWCMRVDRFFVCELRSAKLTAQAETQGCGCHSMLMIGQLISVGQSKRMNFHANKNVVQTFIKMYLWCLDEKPISPH